MTHTSHMISVVLLCAALATPASAQMNFPAMPSEQEAAALAAQGALPGDDALTCEQLGAEMQPYMGPMMASSAALGADAQALQDMQKNMKPPGVGSTALGMGLGVASSFIPGAGIFAQAQAMNQAQQMKRQADAAKPLHDKLQGDSVALAGQMAPVMQQPRFQRLMQLAQAKCENHP